MGRDLRTFESCRQFGTRHFHLEQSFNLCQGSCVALAHQCDGTTIATGTGCAANAVHIVFGIVGHIIVDDHSDVVNVNASCHDVGGHEHVDVASFEFEHHRVALLLFQVRVHGCRVVSQPRERDVEFFHLLLRAGKENDTLGAALGKE